MINEAIILAGGLGTRLRSSVPDLPKCMAPVADHPFLKYVVDYFRRQGITRVVFSLGYKHELIEEFLANEYADLDYSCIIESEPLGTGGAVYKSISEVKSDDVLVLNGDTYFEINLSTLSAFHESNEADCTLSLKQMMKTDRYGTVELDAYRRIQSFKEKQFNENAIVNGGVYALKVPSFAAETFPEKFSFEKDYFEAFYQERKMFGLIQKGYFIDIGIPEDYSRAQQDFKLISL